MIKNAILHGFIKRCQQHGLNGYQINNMLRKMAQGEQEVEPVALTEKEMKDALKAEQAARQGQWGPVATEAERIYNDILLNPTSYDTAALGALGLGGIGGGLGYALGGTPEEKKRRALYGALLGGGAGALGGLGLEAYGKGLNLYEPTRYKQ